MMEVLEDGVCSNLLDLPDAPLHECLRNLGAKDLVAVQQVDRRCRQLASERELWRCGHSLYANAQLAAIHHKTDHGYVFL